MLIAPTAPAIVIEKPAPAAVVEVPVKAPAPVTAPSASTAAAASPQQFYQHVPPVIVIAQAPAEAPAEEAMAPAPASAGKIETPKSAALPEPLDEKVPATTTVAMTMPARVEAASVVPQPPAAKAEIKLPANAPTESIRQSDTRLALAESAPSAAPGPEDVRRWRVVLGSMPEAEKAEMEAERLNARGWAVEAREYRVGDRHGYRIGFGEFLAREEAQKALDEFLVQYPEAPAWLAKY